MKLMVVGIFLFTSFSIQSSFAQETVKKETRQERKAAAKEDAAKADALLQKNDIYDNQVLSNKDDKSISKPVMVRQHSAHIRFHKRKLHHRMRRRF